MAIVEQSDAVRGEGSFAELATPYRPELTAYCYRMTGSIHEAEDLVQETMLRAWRGYPTFEGRSSLRQWLYRIATRVCLTALEERRRRPLPSVLAGPEPDPDRPLQGGGEIEWLEPAPDHLFATGVVDPAAVAIRRADIRLAFIAALQELSAKQRAVLVLRDVLGLRASETAAILETTTTAVNSALVRARTPPPDRAIAADAIAEPSAPALRRTVQGYVDAFERGDPALLVRLLRADVELEMPPNRTWYRGRDAVAGFLTGRALDGAGAYVMRPLRANGQVAVATYHLEADGDHHFHALHVLSLRGERIAGICVFLDPSLTRPFGLPDALGRTARRP